MASRNPDEALAARHDFLRDMGLGPRDWKGWTLARLTTGLFEAAAHNDVDPVFLGALMRDHPDDPDAVWQAWADAETEDGSPNH